MAPATLYRLPAWASTHPAGSVWDGTLTLHSVCEDATTDHVGSVEKAVRDNTLAIDGSRIDDYH